MPFLFATGYGDQLDCPTRLAGAPIVRKPYGTDTLGRAITGAERRRPNRVDQRLKCMTTADARFLSLHAQGFVRVAACTPRATAGDPAANAAATIALARQGDAAGADLLVFPELNLSSYAIDDLHLQDALLDAVEAGIAEIVAASADARAGAAGRRAAAPQRAALQLRAWRSRAGASSASCPRASCPITANITRSAGSPRGVGLTGLRSTSPARPRRSAPT